MRPYVTCSDKDRLDFWREVEGYPDPPGPVPAVVEQGLRQSLPDGGRIERIAVRRKGGGSLGCPRYVAIAVLRGGRVVREAKALVPSAWSSAHGDTRAPIRFDELATGPYRSPDQFLRTERGFIFRRVAADSRKPDFDTTADLQLHRKLLESMGFDLGAIHAASNARNALRAFLEGLEADRLRKTSKRAAKWVKDDFHEWRKAFGSRK